MVGVQIITDCSVSADFVFIAQFACFLVSMAYISQYKLQKWYGTVGIV